MAFKFYHVPIRQCEQVEAELNAFLNAHRVLSVDRRWVDLGADSFWSICVDYLDQQAAARSDGRFKQRAKDYKELLSPEDFAVFVKLRDMRKQVAQAEAVPVWPAQNARRAPSGAVAGFVPMMPPACPEESHVGHLQNGTARFTAHSATACPPSAGKQWRNGRGFLWEGSM